ncbi:uncharacterized protein DUF563 [Sulfuritortus calidifontis]|uniref:Uncharacterized protein DUF563 n=1 Tax=Sulfuritortus calidifontis TaxID=1914471 RepID=A0A4R3JWT1_9PROT|nr:glycosyltransferase 61 family protein [Sulfuritortus calidifontis]TCS71312.1 uncharacterized protein DUF563 [Sulfuritortus calidifontis]
MANPYTKPLHLVRKRIVRWAEHGLMPAIERESAAQLIHHESRQKDWGVDLPDLPEHIQALYRVWQTDPDESWVRLYRGPATLDPVAGLVFVRGRVVWGSTDARPRVRERSPKWQVHWGGDHRRFDAVISLRSIFETNYFHYLNDVLPKLRLAEQLGLPESIPVVVSERLAACRFFADTVRLGFFGGRQVIVQGAREAIAAKEIYVPSDFDCDRVAYDWLCDRLGAGCHADKGGAIYVHRGASSPNRRGYRNEAEVFRLMARHGVRVVDPAEYSLAEQIDLFSRAGLVIGPHGAGLVNLLFRRGPGDLLELFNPNIGTPHYYLIARLRGLGYRWRYNLSPQGKENVASSEMDIAAVELALKELMG